MTLILTLIQALKLTLTLMLTQVGEHKTAAAMRRVFEGIDEEDLTLILNLTLTFSFPPPLSLIITKAWMRTVVGE